MLISLKHGFVFFCMPKCASNSIEAMLRPHCEIQLRGSPEVRHTNMRDWEAYIRPYLSQVARVGHLETVSVFRDPVSWLGSWYRFRARHELRSRADPNSTADLTFLQFVEGYTAARRPPYADVGSQFDFVKTVQGTVGIDHLFGYHDLDALVDYFSQKTGGRLRLRALNVSPRTVHSVDLRERADSLRRRVVSALGRGGRGAVTAAPAVPQLPDSLQDRLRLRIPRDFEIYSTLT